MAIESQVIHQGKGVQCTIYRENRGGKLIAIKDYSQTPWFFRHCVAPVLIRREMRALQILQGITGVPRVYERRGKYGFALEYIDGIPISELGENELDNALLKEVQNVIDAIHARQVSHGDLKRRTNFLVTPAHEVYIIDYASAIIAGCWWRPFTNWLQRQMAQIDNKAVAKIKNLGAPALLTEEELRLLDTPTGLEKWAKKILGR